MDEGLRNPNTANTGVITPSATESTGANVPVSSYAQTPVAYPIESLEGQSQPATASNSLEPTNSLSPLDGGTPQSIKGDNPKPLSYSKRRAITVSFAITVAVTLLTGGILLVANRGAAPEQQATDIPSQAVDVRGEATLDSNLALLSSTQALVVKGDVIARGSLKIAQDELLGTISINNLTENRLYQLPDVSGTLVTVEQVQALLGISLDGVTGTSGGGATTINAVGVSSVNSLAGGLTLQGTSNQVNVASSGSAITLSLPQSIATSSTPTFAGLNTNSITQTASGSSIEINAGIDSITFTAGDIEFIFPTTGPSGQTICTTGISCAEGGGQAVLLASGATAQTENTTFPSIFINDTGGGNLLHLQSGGTDRFVVGNTGTLNGQTISSAANFTGTLTAATSVLAPTLDRASAGALNIGTTTQTSLTIGRTVSAINIFGGNTSEITFGASGGYQFSATPSTLCLGLGCGALEVESIGIGASRISIAAGGGGNELILGQGDESSSILIRNDTILQGDDGGNGSALTIMSGATTSSALIAKGAIGQTVDIFSIQDVNAASLLKVTANGNTEFYGQMRSPYGGFGPYSNMLTRSETLNTSTAWTATNITVTADHSSVNPAPDGLTSAERLVSGASSPRTLTQAVSGGNNTYTFSVWIRGLSGAESGTIRIDSNGTPSTGTATSFTATTTWQRVMVTQTFTSGVTTITPTITMSNSSQTIGAWGAQLVQSSTQQVYQRTTATANTTGGIGLVSNGSAYIANQNAGSVALQVQGASSQTGNLFEIENNGGTDYLAVSASGDITVNGLITTRPIASSPSSNNLTLQGGTNAYGSDGGTAGYVYILGGQSTGPDGFGGNIILDVGTGETSNGSIQIGTDSSKRAHTITLGAANMTGTITLGQSANTNTINIGSTQGLSNNSTQTINIGAVDGSGSGDKSIVTVGGARLASELYLQGGTGGIHIGVNGVDNGGTPTATPTIQIGNTTLALLQNINIGNNATASSETDIVLGSTTSGSTLTIQGGGGISLTSPTLTLSNDTDFALSGGANGISFDGTTLSVDGTNNRVGIGTAAPSAALEVTGDIYLTKEGDRTIKLADSTTAATAGGTLNIVGANGVNAAGGAINMTAGASGGLNAGGAVTITGGSGFGGGGITLSGGTGSLGGGIATLQGGMGSGSDVAGGAVFVDGGQSTGSSNGGTINFRTAPQGSSGSSLNSLVNRMQIQADGDIALDTDTLFVDAVNNLVGIGTTSMTEKLEVAGNIAPDTSEAGDLGTSSLEWDELYLGDGGGISLGLDQDATLAYDEVGDDRVELTGTGATLFIEDRFSLGVDSQTIADSGDASPAALTLNPSSSYVAITCNDTDGCDVTMSESSPVTDGNIVYVINVSANIVNFADTSGVSELAGAFAAAQYDSIHLIYVSDRWVETTRSDN